MSRAGPIGRALAQALVRLRDDRVRAAPPPLRRKPLYVKSAARHPGSTAARLAAGHAERPIWGGHPWAWPRS